MNTDKGNNMIKKPFGEQDPYAIIELIASTTMHGDTFAVDQMPLLAARVSHAASGKTGENVENDKKLIKFLAEKQHMTPFEHQSATFKIVAPLFVIREWHRHRTQSYNEVSMRYSENPVGKFFYPQEWRMQATRNKQSSAGAVEDQEACTEILKNAYEYALQSYKMLQEKGVAREQARIVVPVGNYSEFYATANLRNWAAFCKLRCSPDAQYEIRLYANMISNMLAEIWPESWNVMEEYVIGHSNAE